MSRKSNLETFKALSAKSMATSFSSPVTGVEFLDNVCYQIDITSGTPNGTFAVMVSQDYNQINMGGVPVVTNVGHWIPLDLGQTITITAGDPTDISLDLNQLPYPWIRLDYTAAGGTGACDIFISAKQV